MTVSPSIRKALILLSCTFLGLICGTLYLYSSYSPQFAKRLNYSVSDSSHIALIGSLGSSVTGPLVGLVVDKKGYTISLIIGGVSIVGGYLGMKHQYDTQYSSVNTSAMLLFMVGMGSTFMNAACLKCCAISFPSIRGVATSLPLALYGLSALFYSVIASLFYTGNTSGFLGFLVYSSIVLFCICAPNISLCDQEHKIRLSSNHSRIPSTAASFELESLSPSPRTGNPRNLQRETSYSMNILNNEEISGLQLLFNAKFWIVFAIVGSLASIGQMYIYSCGYVVKALLSTHVSFDTDVIIQKEQQFQVGLLSIANCIGRILGGISSDIISQSFNKPRSWLLFLPALGLMLVQIMGLMVYDYFKLWFVSLFTGLFYGYMFCVMPIIVGDIFGMSSFSSNWGIVGLAPVLPAFYFTGLFGKTFDSNSIVNEDTGVSLCVLGNMCYNSVFRLTFVVTVFAFCMVIVLNVQQVLASKTSHKKSHA